MEQNNKPAQAGGDTRREFIKKATTAAAVVATTQLFKTPVYGQSSAPSTGRVVGANDRISVPVVGGGFGIGKNHLEGIHKEAGANNVGVAGAGDVCKKRGDWAREKAEVRSGDVYARHRRG